MSSRAGSARGDPKAEENDTNVEAAGAADARQRLPSGGSSSLSSPGGSSSSTDPSGGGGAGGGAPTAGSGGGSGAAAEEAFHPPHHAYPHRAYPLHAQYRHHPSMPIPPPPPPPPPPSHSHSHPATHAHSRGRRTTSEGSGAAAGPAGPAAATSPSAVQGSSTAADATSASVAAAASASSSDATTPTSSRSRSRPRAIVIPPSAPRGGVQGALADLNVMGGGGDGGGGGGGHGAGAPTGAAAHHHQQQQQSRGRGQHSKDSKSQSQQHGTGRAGQSGGAARGSSSPASKETTRTTSDPRQQQKQHVPPRHQSHPGAPEVNSSSNSSSSSSSADEHSYSGGEAERSGKHQATPPQEHGRGSATAAGRKGSSSQQRPPPPPPPHGMYHGYFPYHYPPHTTSPAMYPPYHGTPHSYPTPGANSLMTEGGTPPSSMMSPTPLGSINAEIEGEAPAKHQEPDKDMQDLFHTLNAPSFDDSSLPAARPSGSQPIPSKQQQGRRHPAQTQEQHQQHQQPKAKSSGRPSDTPASEGKASDVSSRKSDPAQPTDSKKASQAGGQPSRHSQGSTGAAGGVPMPGPFSHFGNPFAFQQSMMWHHMQQMHQSHQDAARASSTTPSSSKKQKQSGEANPSAAAAAATAAAFFPGYPPFMMGQQQPHPSGAAPHMYGFGPVPTVSSKSSDGKEKHQTPLPPQHPPASYYAGMGMPWGPGWPGPFPPYAPYGGQVPPREGGALGDDNRSGGKEETQDEIERPAMKAKEAPSAKSKPSAAPPKKRAEASVAFEDEAGTATPPEQKKQRVKHGEYRSMSNNSLTDMTSPRKTSSPDRRGSKRSAALQLASPHIPRTPSGAAYYNSFGTPAGQDHSIEYGRDLFASNSFGGFSINDGEVGSPNHHWDTGLEDWRPEISSGQRRCGGDIASPFPTTDMFNMSPMTGSGGTSALLGSPVGGNSMGIYRPSHVPSPSGRGMRPDLEPVPMLSASSSKKGKANSKSKKKKTKTPTQKSRPTPRSLHPPSSPQPSHEQPDSSATNPLGLEDPMISSDDPMRYFVQLGGAGSTIGDVRRGMNDINAAMERARAMMPLPPPPPPPPPAPSSFTGTPSVYYPSAGGYGDAMSYSEPIDPPQGADSGSRDASTEAFCTESEYRTPARSSKSGSRSKSRSRSSSDVNFAEFEPPRSRSEAHRAPSAPQTTSAKAVDVTPSNIVSSASGKKQRASSSKTSAAKASAKTPSKKAPARSPRETPRRKTPPSSRKSRPMPTPSPDSKGAGRGGSSKGCNCKKSKCLKKYCECFAQQAYCSDGCRCQACCNTVENEDLRSKAIEEMKRKDSDAFEQKNSSCNCKKSKCLKKYCDCFQAGIMCGETCKCKDCENYKGSQKLIDRRTKIKDTKGAELAMTASDEIWRGEQPAQVTPAAAAPPSSVASRRRGSPASSYSSSPASMLDDPSAVTSMHPQFDGGSATSRSRHPTDIGYSPASMRTPMHGPQVEAAKRAAASAARSSSASRKRQSATNRAANTGSTRSAPSQSRSSRSSRVVTASHPGRGARKLSRTPRSPVQTKVRVDYDAIASKRRRMLKPGHQEATRKYFGSKRPAVSKTSALAVFSYFSNEDTYNASLVSKQWNDLAFDDELWQLE